MGRKIVAGNWKMNMLREEAESFLVSFKRLVKERATDVEIYLFPTFVHLGACVGDSSYVVGAQDCSDQPKGAFTGEVSAQILASYGVEAVLIGHSERRTRFGEDDGLLRRKIAMAQSAQLTPFYCVGESAEIRERGDDAAWDFVLTQLDTLGYADPTRLVIAYEPIWAIGTGMTATAEEAGTMCSLIADEMKRRTGIEVPVLYGGSCNVSNASDIFAQSGVSGGLIGGASLNAESFLDIAAAFPQK